MSFADPTTIRLGLERAGWSFTESNERVIVGHGEDETEITGLNLWDALCNALAFAQLEAAMSAAE